MSRYVIDASAATEYLLRTPVGRRRRELQEIVEGLAESETRLRAVHGSLAPSTEAARAEAESEDDEKGASTAIRTAIECVLTDSLGPAIRDLQAVALGRLS